MKSKATAILASVGVVIAVSSGAIGGMVGARASSTPTGIFSDTSDNAIQFSMGTIRHPTTGPWVVLGDDKHLALNLTGVTCKANGDLSVTFTQTLDVVGASVGPDETFSRAGFVIGASVGLNEMVLRVSKVTTSGVTPVHCNSPALVSNRGNFWLQAFSAPAPPGDDD